MQNLREMNRCLALISMLFMYEAPDRQFRGHIYPVLLTVNLTKSGNGIAERSSKHFCNKVVIAVFTLMLANGSENGVPSTRAASNAVAACIPSAPSTRRNGTAKQHHQIAL